MGVMSETITFVLVIGFQWFRSEMKGLDALFKNIKIRNSYHVPDFCNSASKTPYNRGFS